MEEGITSQALFIVQKRNVQKSHTKIFVLIAAFARELFFICKNKTDIVTCLLVIKLKSVAKAR